MRRKVGTAVCALTVLISCAAGPEASVEELSITVREDDPRQVVRHFGASAAWWAQAVGHWPEPTVNRIVDLLYDDESGIGLDIVRYNLGGGTEHAVVSDRLRKAETIELSPGSFDARPDAAAIGVVDRAVSRGAEVVLFANSPPSRLTVTGAPNGNGRASNLAAGSERDFARYLVDAAEYISTTRGWPIGHISPINEPQWDWAPKNGQEGSYYSPEQAYRVVRALYDEVHERGLDYTISAVESGEMKLASNLRFIDLMFADAQLRSALDHYAVHSYWSAARDRQDLWRYLSSRYPEVELWMTEWTEMKAGKDLSMDAALVLAATVHQDMVYANASSWQYWIALSPYDYRDGLLYIDLSTRTFQISKKLWALGNWSRFIDAGARRLETEPATPRSLLASAYRNPDRSIVVVLVNLHRSDRQQVQIHTATTFTQMEVHQTSAELDLEQVYDGPSSVATVPPQSVVTVVLH